MLLGEHAVVYGYPCIVTAISQRLYVKEGNSTGDTRFLDAAIKLWGTSSTKLSADCLFSGKYGFGSSSAVTVAALKALKPNAPNKDIFDAAYKIVLDIQGAGSGFDVAAATHGGTLYYVKNKTIEPLAISDMPLIVGYTGIKSSTIDIVNTVAAKRDAYPEKVDRIFLGIAKLVDQAKEKMLTGDWERVGRLMDFDQEYLRDLGVSSEKLEALIKAAKRAGAWGAKLSGAGGGDCMIAMAPPDRRQAVEDAIADAGGEVARVTPDAEGVRIETTDNQDELFIVVDRDDTILGYKTRYECHHDKTLIHRVVGALIFDEAGRILLQKRSMTKDMGPGLWGISAAGHVTKGQTDEEAVHRELQEELGVDIPLTFWKKFISEEPSETERDMIYKGMSDGPFHPNAEEVSEVRFFEIRELKFLCASRHIRLTAGAARTLREVEIL